jgi:hypothetical protein
MLSPVPSDVLVHRDGKVLARQGDLYGTASDRPALADAKTPPTAMTNVMPAAAAKFVKPGHGTGSSYPAAPGRGSRSRGGRNSSNKSALFSMFADDDDDELFECADQKSFTGGAPAPLTSMEVNKLLALVEDC